MLNQKVDNVVGLNNESVHSEIMTFLDSRKSKNTQQSYSKAIKDFFMYMTGKQTNELTEEDLKFKHSQIIKYQKYLQRKFKNSTVNNKIFAVKSLYQFLARNEYDVKPDIFDVDSLNTHDTETIGFFKDHHEALQMVELAKQLPRGEMKSVLFELAIKTSIRLSALLNLRWRDIKPVEGTEYWLVKTVDKGSKKVEKDISQNLYKRIEGIKPENAKRNDLIFNIGSRAISDDVKRLCEMMNIDEDRNISFHSFRKVAAMWEIKENGDVVAAARALNHSGINTAYKYYIDENRDHESATGVAMEKEEDMSKIEELSKEELIELIKMSSRRTQRELNELAGKVVEDRDSE